MADDVVTTLSHAFQSATRNKIMTKEVAADLLARCETAIDRGSVAFFPIGPEMLRELLMAWRRDNG